MLGSTNITSAKRTSKTYIGVKGKREHDEEVLKAIRDEIKYH